MRLITDESGLINVGKMWTIAGIVLAVLVLTNQQVQQEAADLWNVTFEVVRTSVRSGL